MVKREILSEVDDYLGCNTKKNGKESYNFFKLPRAINLNEF
jgi:hypothetical protein